MEPPKCVQNAMMTKDKKPFTYTPGGIDLSEIRSPRLGRRIERNANYGGVESVPTPQHHNVPHGPLPPLTVAAMQPQMQVQVFPSGPAPAPPMSRGGVPLPPPPPPSNKIPPPPPPAMPTQKVMTSENQVVERPDMTKIIPDNPMTLLRRTGGPRPRSTLLDEVYTLGGQENVTPQARPTQAQQYSPPVQTQEQNKGGVAPPWRGQQQQSPPAQQTPQWNQQSQQQSPQPQWNQQVQQQSPPVQQPSQWSQPPQRTQQNQQSPPLQQTQQWAQPQAAQWSPPAQQQKSPQAPQSPPTYHNENTPAQPKWAPPAPIIERTVQEKPVPKAQVQQPQQQQQPEKRVNIGSIYIPPLNQNQNQANVSSPPPPPERFSSPKIQSPTTPTLKESPKPWQTKNTQQKEAAPEWTVRDSVPEQNPLSQTQAQTGASRWPQNRPTTPQPGSVPIRIEIRTNVPQMMEPDDAFKAAHPNAVFVTQPVVLVHGGPGPQSPSRGPQNVQPQQQQRSQPQQQPQNQGARVIPIQIECASPSPKFTRQQSWNSTPNQSNSFKVLQKMTEADDIEQSQPISEHSPKFPQKFPMDQTPRFKQVPPSSTSSNGTHVVRNIPVQIEGEETPRKYVPPSEQTVAEPKKYTGSSIPSRSFKILQAMTAEQCANAEANEKNDNDPNWENYPVPYPPHPYWPYYPPPSFNSPRNSTCNENLKENFKNATLLNWHHGSNNSTPVHFWYPPCPNDENADSRGTTPQPYYGYPPFWVPDLKSQNSSGTTTPVQPSYTKDNETTNPGPYFGYPPYWVPPENTEEECDGTRTPVPFYPPYFDPYYMAYYYGYPPCGIPSGTQMEPDGYSSMDEMAIYNKSRRSSALDTGGNSTPRIIITPTLPNEEAGEISDAESETSSEENDEESEPQRNQSTGLKSIRSVQNIHIFQKQNSSDDEDGPIVEEFSSSDESDENSSIYVLEEESNQLSVILEETEGTENRNVREESVLSDSTTIADEDQDYVVPKNEEIEVSFTLKSPTSPNKSFAQTIETPKAKEEKEDSYLLKEELSEYFKKQRNSLRCELFEITNEDQSSNINEDCKKIYFEELERLKKVVTNKNQEKSQLQMEECAKIKFKNKETKTGLLPEDNCLLHKEDEEECDFIDKQIENHVDKLNVPQDYGENYLDIIEETVVKVKSEESKTKTTDKSNTFPENRVEETCDILDSQKEENNNVKVKSEESKTKTIDKSNSFPEKKVEETCDILSSQKEENNDDEDWWGVLSKDDDLPPRKTNLFSHKDTCLLNKIEETEAMRDNEELHIQEDHIDTILEHKNEETTLKAEDTEQTNDENEETEDEIDFWSVLATDEPTPKGKSSTNSVLQSSSVRPKTPEEIIESEENKTNLISSVSDISKITSEIINLASCVAGNRNDINLLEKREKIKLKDLRNEASYNTLETKHVEYSQKEILEDQTEIQTNNDFEKIEIKENEIVETQEKIIRTTEEIMFSGENKTEIEKIIRQEEHVEINNEANQKVETHEKLTDTADKIIIPEEDKTKIEEIITKEEDDVEINNEADQKVETQNLINEGNDQQIEDTHEIKNEDSSECESEDTSSDSTSTTSEESKTIQKTSNQPETITKNYQITIRRQSSLFENQEQSPQHFLHKSDENNNDSEENEEISIDPPTIKQRIKALQKSAEARKIQKTEEEPGKLIIVKEKVTQLETCDSLRSKTTSSKSSVKSFEEYSEDQEDLDSGITSDLSRQISECDEFSELKKLSRYQRAATHSRLFKLLQDDLEDEEMEEETKIPDKFSKLSVRKRQADLNERKQHLNLPLKVMNQPEADLNSPLDSPSNDKLVGELVQSILKRKQGRIFRNMSTEKLHAAAKKALQEDSKSEDGASDFMSPLRETGSSTPMETPQEFYNSEQEYKQYYNSWGDALNDNYDILPSKANKALNNAGSKVLAKCPLQISSSPLRVEIDKTKNT